MNVETPSSTKPKPLRGLVGPILVWLVGLQILWATFAVGARWESNENRLEPLPPSRTSSSLREPTPVNDTNTNKARNSPIDKFTLPDVDKFKLPVRDKFVLANQPSFVLPDEVDPETTANEGLQPREQTIRKPVKKVTYHFTKLPALDEYRVVELPAFSEASKKQTIASVNEMNQSVETQRTTLPLTKALEYNQFVAPENELQEELNEGSNDLQSLPESTEPLSAIGVEDLEFGLDPDMEESDFDVPVDRQIDRKEFADQSKSILSSFALKQSLRTTLTAAPEKIKFDLTRMIESLLRNSPLVRIAELETGIKRADVEREDAAFDWTNFIETTWGESNQPVASMLDGAANRVVNHDWDLAAGLRRLNRRGGNFSVQQQAGLSDSNSSFFDPNNQADANIAIEYQRPLLRGGGVIATVSRFEIANVEAFISEADLVAELQKQILAAATAYWGLVSARGEFVIQQRTLQLGREIVEIIENRVGVDTGPEQLIRAKANLATREKDFLRAKYDLFAAQERLLQLIFGAGYEVESVVEIITEGDLVNPQIIPDLHKELEVALQNRPEIRRALNTIRRGSIEQGVALNQLLPVLDLTMALSNRGLRGNRGLASAFNEQFSFGDPTYSFGLSYERPYGNRTAKAGATQADLRLRQFQQQLQQTISDVALEIKLVAFDIVEAHERLELAECVLDTASKDYKIRLDRYELMVDEKSAVNNYLDNLFASQDRLARAQVEFVQALTEYSLVDIRFQNARGTLTRPITK